MFQIANIMTSYFSNNSNSGSGRGGYMNLMSSIYENESRKSSIGSRFTKNDGMAMSVFNYPVAMSASGMFSQLGEKTKTHQKDALSEIRRVNNLSHLSEAGSDEYREALMKNDDFMDDYVENEHDS